MVKRKIALEIIRIDAAKHGKVTRDGLRAYAENNVSYKAFNEAANQGLKQYQHRHTQNALTKS